MLEIGLISFLGGIAAWMYFTTPRVREAVFGYMVLIAVAAVIYGLLSGQAPNSHY